MIRRILDWFGGDVSVSRFTLGCFLTVVLYDVADSLWNNHDLGMLLGVAAAVTLGILTSRGLSKHRPKGDPSE